MATDIRPRGSRNNNCHFCGDDASGSCSTCNECVCKDCKIDHPCLTEEVKKEKKK